LFLQALGHQGADIVELDLLRNVLRLDLIILSGHNDESLALVLPAIALEIAGSKDELEAGTMLAGFTLLHPARAEVQAQVYQPHGFREGADQPIGEQFPGGHEGGGSLRLYSQFPIIICLIIVTKYSAI